MKKRPVARTKTIDPSRLTEDGREALCDALFGIYRGLFALGDREFFKHHVLFPKHDDMRIALMYSEEGSLIGYSNVYVCDMLVDGKTCAIFRGAIFSKLGYDTARCAKRLGLRVSLRHRLLRPTVPQWLFVIAATPASYRMFARALHEFYPRAEANNARGEVLASKLARAFEFESPPGCPWVCRLDTAPVDARRLERSRSLAHDPHAQFYRELVGPHGEGHVLFVLLPVTLRNLWSAVWGLVRSGQKKRRRSGAWSGAYS